MRSARLTALVGAVAVAAALRVHASEVNAWPAAVIQEDASGQVESWSALGPLFFSEPAPRPEKGTFSGFRPLFVELDTGSAQKTDILYPLFYYRRYPAGTRWSVFQLINGDEPAPEAPGSQGGANRRLDVWPFYFSMDAADPSESYHAVLPIYGSVNHFLGFTRISWAAFPLYAQTVKKGTETTYVAWPIVRSVQGRENGFGVWPLFGVTDGPGASHHAFFLWPLVWDNRIAPGPDEPPEKAPGRQLGVIPFYTLETRPGYVNENYLWPFFGHTEATAPSRYSETRYFWPFLVQGHGDDAVVERWGPFYTHSQSKGVDSTWKMWPLWHRTTWADGDIEQSKTQFFYFLYSSLDQSSLSRPGLEPAFKRHLWPLLSVWDNGAGSRQVQFPSPLEVFFPDNPDMRATWSPFFSVFRYDRRPSGETRTSLLWDAVTWRQSGSGALEELHLGPLLGVQKAPSGSRWSILGFDFGAKQRKSDKPLK